jgi:PHD/YefM family antitoxin component YafN of YafNO toxin-antitoxin module
MQTIRSIHLQKNLGDVLKAADLEAVVVMNRDQPRAVMMSAEEFIRLKTAAGEAVPKEVRRSRPTLHQSSADPLAYDTRDPDYVLQLVEDALAGRHAQAIRSEVQAALRRWGMR